jgi:glycosyltransferase involved in cell wall biosynthesis
MPQVSVIMPVFNAEAYLAASVESIISQTFADFEFIIIDDGSTDRSLSILQRYLRQDRRVHLISRPNKGYSNTLNEAIDLASGGYLARMDADDIACPRRLERQVSHLDANRRCAAVGGWIELIDPENAPICCSRYPQTHCQIDAAHFEGKGSCLAHPAVLMRADAVRDVGKYRPVFEPAEDFDLWLRLSDKYELANVPEIVLRYRLHEQSQSHLRREAQFHAARRALAEGRQRRNLPAIDETAVGPAAANAWRDARRRWVKLAQDAGETANARRLALKLLCRAPLSPSSWRTGLVAALGRQAPQLLQRFRLMQRWAGLAWCD